MRQDERGKGQGLEDGKERDPGAGEVATSRSTVVGPPGSGTTLDREQKTGSHSEDLSR